MLLQFPNASEAKTIELVRYPIDFPGDEGVVALITKLKILGLYNPKPGYEGSVKRAVTKQTRWITADTYWNFLDMLRLHPSGGEQRSYYDPATGRWLEAWINADLTTQEYVLSRRVYG
jgi:hypothetical protein